MNDTPDACFYPCEGVIAVGEVKSVLGTKELQDAFINAASVKCLKRRAIPEQSDLLQYETVAFRKFGASISMAGTKSEEFNQQAKASDQVFSFILCNEFGIKVESLLEKSCELWKAYPAAHTPNLIVSLKNGFFSPHESVTNKLVSSVMVGDQVVYSPDSEKAMGYLVHVLNDFIRAARTVEIKHFMNYFKKEGSRFSVAQKKSLKL
ncbi:MAG TPA: hypothetical protein PKB01_03340 [Xanthobacteraceae bacterium]|nr:hypothetical protein [Xanthobacteraceae bacterium]